MEGHSICPLPEKKQSVSHIEKRCVEELKQQCFDHELHDCPAERACSACGALSCQVCSHVVFRWDCVLKYFFFKMLQIASLLAGSADSVFD